MVVSYMSVRTSSTYNNAFPIIPVSVVSEDMSQLKLVPHHTFISLDDGTPRSLYHTHLQYVNRGVVTIYPNIMNLFAFNLKLTRFALGEIIWQCPALEKLKIPYNISADLRNDGSLIVGITTQALTPVEIHSNKLCGCVSYVGSLHYS